MKGSAGVNDYRRPEARAFPWYTLIDHHREALGQLMRLLRSAVEALPKPTKPPQDPMSRARTLRVRPHRASQLAFLDGKRGTGKTSVELSLRRAFLTPDEGTGQDGMSEMTAVPAGHKHADEVHALRRDAEVIKPHLIWLTPLDMEPLPEGVNALAAILTRFEQAVADLDREQTAYRGLLARSEQGSELIGVLDSLRTDVVYAWDGGTRSRSPGQDLDSWAEEVMRAERARLDLNARFEHLLDHIAWHQREHGRENPLFVMVVDDFDLNPSLCVELLRVVRMITTPRLFFILAGDLEMAKDVMHLKAAGEGTRLLGSAPKRSVFEREVLRTARATAANNLRKLVPPSHRVKLRALEAQEALDLNLSERDLTLKAALAEIEVATGWGDRSMDVILRGPWHGNLPGRFASGPVRFFERFLTVPVRVLVDTEAQLRVLSLDSATTSPGSKPTGVDIANVLAEELERRLGETTFDGMSDEGRAALQQSIRIRTPSFACAASPIPTVLEGSTTAAHSYVPVSGYVWYLKSGKDQLPELLPPGFAAGLVLVHDLSVAPEGASTNGPYRPDGGFFGKEHRLGWTAAEGTGPIQLDWPRLGWERIGDSMLFELLWSDTVAAGPPDPQTLLTSWLKVWSAIESGEHARISRAFDIAEWAQSLKFGIKGPWSKQRRADVLAMLAPEMGWPEDTVEPLLTRGEIRELAQDEEIAAGVRALRVARLRGSNTAQTQRFRLPLLSPDGRTAFLVEGDNMLASLRNILMSSEQRRTPPGEDWVKWLATMRSGLKRIARHQASKALRPAFARLYEDRDLIADALPSVRAEDLTAILDRFELLLQHLTATATTPNAYNALAGGALCPSLGTLQAELGWPAFDPFEA